MKRILWGLAIIIIPAFVLWGAAGTRGGRASQAGVMFGKKVTLRQFSNAWEAVKNEALMTYGARFYDMVEILDLDNQAWERLMNLHEAKKRKIKISDEEVRTYISSIPFFQKEDGTFDQRSYEIILANTFRVDARKFEEDVRDRLAITKLVQEIMKDTKEVTEEEIDEALLKEEEFEKEREEAAVEEETVEKEETPEEKRERIKNSLLMQKRFQALQAWQTDLRQKANLVDNIAKLKEQLEEEEPTEEIPESLQ